MADPVLEQWEAARPGWGSGTAGRLYVGSSVGAGKTCGPFADLLAGHSQGCRYPRRLSSGGLCVTIGKLALASVAVIAGVGTAVAFWAVTCLLDWLPC